MSMEEDRPNRQPRSFMTRLRRPIEENEIEESENEIEELENDDHDMEESDNDEEQLENDDHDIEESDNDDEQSEYDNNEIEESENDEESENSYFSSTSSGSQQSEALWNPGERPNEPDDVDPYDTPHTVFQNEFTVNLNGIRYTVRVFNIICHGQIVGTNIEMYEINV
eukprot:443417_1